MKGGGREEWNERCGVGGPLGFEAKTNVRSETGDWKTVFLMKVMKGKEV
jgi:hypothetical protein